MRSFRAALVAGLVLLLVAVAASAAPRGAQRATDAAVFAGLGTWIDVYDTALYGTPNLVASRLAARGVATAWIETANDRSSVDVVDPVRLGRLVDALQARGIQVVAWYLPGHDDQARDVRRALAMLRFRTPGGAAFDGVALDVESLREKNVARRTSRLLALLARLNREAGDVPVAAITYPPRALERHATWWPRFPWAQIAGQVDALVPMLYTGGGFKGYDATYGYVARSLELLRASVGVDVPIHAAGGVANRMTAEELKAFADAVVDQGGVVGWSLYDLQTITGAGWKALAPAGPLAGG